MSSVPEESATAARPTPATGNAPPAASLATGILLAHADVNVALIAVGVGIPALGLVGLPTLLNAELGLLHGIPRTASVSTRLPSTLLRIGGQDFLSTLQARQPSPSLLSVAGTRMARTPRNPTPRNQDHEPR